MSQNVQLSAERASLSGGLDAKRCKRFEPRCIWDWKQGQLYLVLVSPISRDKNPDDKKGISQSGNTVHVDR